MQGSNPQSKQALIVEQKYAEANGLNVGDSIDLNGSDFKIAAIACVPDYIYTLKNTTDLGTNNEEFGLIFVADEAFDEITNTSEERVHYKYAYKIANQEKDAEDLKDYLLDLPTDENLITDSYLKDSFEEVADFKEQRDEAITALIEGSQTLTDGLTAQKDGLDELATSLESTQSMVQEVGGETLGEAFDLSIGAVETLSLSTSELKDGNQELTNGIESLGDSYIEITDEIYSFEPTNPSSFLEKEDNKQINAAQDDASIYKMSALYSGVIVFALIAFIFSVFAIHSVDESRETIGTLYALGYRRRELVMHFLILPVIVVLLGSLIGLGIGYIFTSLFGQGNMDLYSYPPLSLSVEAYLLLYALVLPNLLTVFINYFVLNNKLDQKPPSNDA